MEREVVAISKKADKYFVVLDDDTKIRVDSVEFKKVKRMLSRGSILYLQVNEESESVELPLF